MTDKTETRRAADPKAPPPPIGKWIGIGVGAGIGSAAIAAALLYTTGTRRKNERK